MLIIVVFRRPLLCFGGVLEALIFLCLGLFGEVVCFSDVSPCFPSFASLFLSRSNFISASLFSRFFFFSSLTTSARLEVRKSVCENHGGGGGSRKGVRLFSPSKISDFLIYCA